MELLLEHGANVTSKHDGLTPLHLSASSSNPNCTKLLLAAGANAEERDASGCTPLHLSANGGRTEAALECHMGLE